MPSLASSVSPVGRLIGFEKTRVKDICRDLGISRRSFRKHFNSLDDILEVV